MQNIVQNKTRFVVKASAKWFEHTTALAHSFFCPVLISSLIPQLLFFLILMKTYTFVRQLNNNKKPPLRVRKQAIRPYRYCVRDVNKAGVITFRVSRDIHMLLRVAP